MKCPPESKPVKPDVTEALKGMVEAARRLMYDQLGGEIQEGSLWYPLFEAMNKGDWALQPITIVIEGGILQSIDNLPAGLKVVVMDFDIDNVALEDLKQTDEGDFYVESVHVN